MMNYPNKATRTDDWLTPRWVLDPLGPFDLDPCASIKQPWKTAKTQWTIDDDGLSRHWGKYRRVWLNPPYGGAAKEWVQRLTLHGQGLLLWCPRTGTIAWQEYIFPKASALFFFKGRIRFCRPITGEQALAFNDSVLVSYGKEELPVMRRLPYPGKLITL